MGQLAPGAMGDGIYVDRNSSGERSEDDVDRRFPYSVGPAIRSAREHGDHAPGRPSGYAAPA
jgi:hypothetical protein